MERGRELGGSLRILCRACCSFNSTPKLLGGDHVQVHGVEVEVGNDLEGVAMGLLPQIGEMKAALMGAGALAACMTGSGPTVFGLFEDAKQAQAAEEEVTHETDFLALATPTLPSR